MHSQNGDRQTWWAFVRSAHEQFSAHRWGLLELNVLYQRFVVLIISVYSQVWYFFLSEFGRHNIGLIRFSSMDWLSSIVEPGWRVFFCWIPANFFRQLAAFLHARKTLQLAFTIYTIFWVRPTSISRREMNARGYALHSLCPNFTFLTPIIAFSSKFN